ncbi:hypothetical protein K227x_38540 [Rubripirellula lacrimiformis]|uniref:Uncharacterized protein n=1 Tax=Rubripirellula lacrimiformis TaxID=1930273 RepID=A0A517NEA2_9BACT|nr:hypothetical protein K227x_38540 [Rubripirellula lacrimiformis]
MEAPRAGFCSTKTAHLMMTGCGTHNIAAVASSMRFVPIGHLTIKPKLLPPAEEVQMAK